MTKRYNLLLAFYCLLFSTITWAQTTTVIYPYGYIENTGGQPILIDFTASDGLANYSASAVSQTDGSFITTLTMGSLPWQSLTATFQNCLNETVNITSWNDSITNLVDIYMYLNYCTDSTVYVYGCTDSTAVNYNPNANVSDGSCIYSSPANDLCSEAVPLSPGTIAISNLGATQNENIWGSCWSFGQGEGEQSSIWYTFTTPDTAARIVIEALYDSSFSLTDTQFGLFESCGGPMIHCDGNSGEGLMSKFDFSCDVLEPSTTYILIIDGYFGNSGTALLDYQILDCQEPVYGCTDSGAINFNPLATVDNGSCQYADSCDQNLATIHLTTANWGYEISWELIWNDSVLVAEGADYENNESYLTTACLPDGCYTLNMFDSYGDGWNAGSIFITWGNEFIFTELSEGFSGQYLFSINDSCNVTPIYGCTDPAALNYNPNATVSDGSCMYADSCLATVASFGLYTGSTGENLTWSIYNTETFEMVAFQSGYPNYIFENNLLCLEDGCYTLQFDGLNGSAIDSASFTLVYDNTVIFDVLEGYTPQYQFGINASCTDTTQVYGCTDSLAVNYNPLATIDDGSCAYGLNCEVSFLAYPDTAGEPVLWIIPAGELWSATSVLWDFGDGTTSTDLLPSHTYATDGPYMLCLTAYFSNPADSCTTTFCMEIDASMIYGKSSGFTINIAESLDVLSTNLVDSQQQLEVFPNPAQAVVRLRLTNTISEALSLEIYSVDGKLIQTEQVLSNELNEGVEVGLDDWPNGMYFISLKGKTLNCTKSLLIQH